MTWPTQHFTADDLDAFHSASLTAEASQHLEECEECRTLTLQDRALLETLSSLPSFTPREDFADRVMARLQPPIRSPLPLRLRTPRQLALTSLVVGLIASIGWSLFNQARLRSWLERGAADLGNSVWLAVATLAQNLTEQPWFPALREFGSSLGRIAIAGGILLIGYVAALVALRRLLQPIRQVPDANW